MKEIKLLKTVLYFVFAFIVMAYLIIAIVLEPFVSFLNIEISSTVLNVARLSCVILALLHIWAYPKILSLINKDLK